MTTEQIEALPALYERDETAWLEQMAELVRQRRIEDLDFPNLGEFLLDMAKRDRREVESRLAVLIAHLLKWTYQPERRSGGWRATVEVQRHELELLLQSGTLHTHAEESLAAAYAAAVRQAAAETGMSIVAFPTECPYSVEGLVRLEQLPD